MLNRCFLCLVIAVAAIFAASVHALDADLRKKLEAWIEQLAHRDFSVRKSASDGIRRVVEETLAKAKQAKGMEDIRALDELYRFLMERLRRAKDVGVRLELERFLTLLAPYAGWGLTNKVLRRFPDILRYLGSSDGVTRANTILKLRAWGDRSILGPLVRALKDESWYIRLLAAIGLAKLGDERAVGPLIKGLKHREPDTRRVAAYALGEIGDRRAVEPLLQALKREKNGAVRVSVVAALGKIGDKRAVGPLIEMLGKESYGVARTAAAEALGQIGDGRAVALLVRVLKEDDFALAREAAARALGRLGDRRAVGPLIKALKEDGEWTVRAAAAEALGMLGDREAFKPLLQALKDKDAHVCAAALKSLARVGKPAHAIFLNALGEHSAVVRAAAAEVLGMLGDRRDVVSLVRALKKDEECVVREAVVRALGRLGGKSVVEPLIQALADRDFSVRGAAAEALVRVGEPAVEPLIEQFNDCVELLENEREMCTRIFPHVAAVLGMVGDERAVGPLIRVLAVRNANARLAAAQALLCIGKPAAKPLVKALMSRSCPVRRYAAEILGRIGGEGVVGPLVQALKDNDGDVREAAAGALQKLTGMRFGTDYRKWRKWWRKKGQKAPR